MGPPRQENCRLFADWYDEGSSQTALMHKGEQGLEKAGGPPVIGVGKGGAGHRLDPQVIEALDASFQTGDGVPQTDSGRELHGK